MTCVYRAVRDANGKIRYQRKEAEDVTRGTTVAHPMSRCANVERANRMDIYLTHPSITGYYKIKTLLGNIAVTDWAMLQLAMHRYRATDRYGRPKPKNTCIISGKIIAHQSFDSPAWIEISGLSYNDAVRCKCCESATPIEQGCLGKMRAGLCRDPFMKKLAACVNWSQNQK